MMEFILDSYCTPGELMLKRTRYAGEVKNKGKAENHTQLDFAWYLIRTPEVDAIKKGMGLLEELCQKADEKERSLQQGNLEAPV